MKLSVASIGALVAALAVAAPASADTMASPVVKVNACGGSAASAAQNYMNVFGGSVTQAATPAMLMIDFKNVSQKPISSVEFGYVQNGKVRATVRDAGTFDPDSVVMHAFALGDASLVANASTMSCVPLRVKFADGSTWMNPEMPAKP
jgi:hypothetical protein